MRREVAELVGLVVVDAAEPVLGVGGRGVLPTGRGERQEEKEQELQAEAAVSMWA